MRRVALVLLAVLTVGAVALPYMLGRLAEQRYESLLGRIQRYPSAELAVGGITYERGWLESSAETQVGIPSAGAGWSLALHHRIYHGPLAVLRSLREGLAAEWVLAEVDTAVRSDAWAGPGLTAALAGEPLFRIRTTVLPDGRGRAELSSPPLHQPAEGLVWGGLRGTLEFDTTEASASGQIELPVLSLTDSASTLRLEGVVANFEIAASSAGIPVGEVSLRGKLFERSDAAAAPSEGLGLSDWRVRQTLVADSAAELLQLTTSLGFGGLSSGGERYGPGALDVELRNLSSEALGRFRARRAELAAQSRTATPARLANLALLLELLPVVFMKSPDMELTRLSVGGQGGELSGHARIRVPAGRSRQLRSIGDLIASLEAGAELHIPADMLQIGLDFLVDRRLARRMTTGANAEIDPAAQRFFRTAARSRTLERLLAQNVLTLDGDAYRIQLSYLNSELRVNGSRMEIGALSRLF